MWTAAAAPAALAASPPRAALPALGPMQASTPARAAKEQAEAAVLSPTPDRLEGEASLSRALAALMGDGALQGSNFGLLVQRLEGGQPIYAHRADALLVPASNVKLVTTAASLDQLGPDYQFSTEIYGSLRPDGTIAQDLYVKGFGDPTLVPERLWLLAARLRYLGLKSVEGNLVVDDSFFAGETRAFGYQADTSANAYMAPAGALSASFNALMVHLLPSAHPGQDAQVLVEPSSDYAPIVGRVGCGRSGRSQIGVRMVTLGGRESIEVSGHFAAGDSGRSMWRRVGQPARFAGAVLHKVLGEVGIHLGGEVVVGKVPAQAPLMMRFLSPPLAEVVGPLNKYSNNFMAAQLAFVLGAHHGGAPGTWPKGQAAIGHFLQDRLGLGQDSYVLRNASGLHEVNLFSVRQLVAVISHAAKDPRLGPEFVRSLATAGGIGTLQDRMQEGPAAGRLRAKTGTLAGAAALSGLVPTQDGTPLVFSFVVNGFHRIEAVWSVQDRLGHLMANAASL